eukprot:1161368-Pelagomonas_calceolata.AAC.4
MAALCGKDTKTIVLSDLAPQFEDLKPPRQWLLSHATKSGNQIVAREPRGICCSATTSQNRKE